MRLLNAVLVAASLIAVPAVPALAAPAKQVPLRDFFRNPEQAAHNISPDGKWIAYLAPWEKRLNIHVRPVAGGEGKRITGETARDIAGFAWKGNDRLIYAKDFGGDENFHIVSVDREGKDLKDLTPFEKVRAQMVDDLKDHPTDLLLSHNKRDPKVFDVFRVNVNTGEAKMVAQNPGNIVGWLTDHEGKLRVALTTDGVNTSILMRDAEDQPFKPVLTTNFREGVTPSFFTFDNKKLYATSNRGRDRQAVVIFDPATTKEEVLFEHPEVDVSGVSYSRKRKVLTAATFVTWKTERHFFDKEVEAIFKDLQAKLPGYEPAITSFNRDEDKLIVASTGDKTRGKRYLYDKATRKLDFIADISPWLPEAELADMKPVQYKTRDGLTIHGYLTLPKGVAAKNLPVVVNPHGGPWARDRWGFNPEVQFLANRGYAVFQMNFRGSTGYGRKFWEASFKEWGRKMQDDVTDGVQWLIKEGVADPKRVAIYGGSYGGYTTLAGLAFTPELYAAGVDYVGVSNLLTFMKTIPPYWKPYLEMLQEMVGNLEKDVEMLKAASPVFHADKIKAPLFIAQGAKDPRVVKAESDQMVEAMRKRGVEVEYMVKDNEGHGFANEENRFEFYEAMEKFLRKHIKS